jgi:Sulfotransferase domain
MTASPHRLCFIIVVIIASFYAGKISSERRCARGESSDDTFIKSLSSTPNIRGGIHDDVKMQNQFNPSNYSWKAEMLKFFSSKHCLASTSGNNAEDWLDQIFILIGVPKGGTKAIHTFLEENPMFASRCSEQLATMEMFFFNNNITHNIDPIDQQFLQTEYAKTFQSKCPLAVSTLKNNSMKMYLDDTPTYMQDSHEIPQLLNCVMPKAKIVAVLRDPSQRAFSHYNYYLERNWCTEFTFEEWVDLNIKDLETAGVLGARDPYEELMAWKEYNDDLINRGLRKCRTFITRGLYAIQLLHFMTALEASGRPKSDLHIILSEKLSGNTRQNEYDKLVNFLGLESHALLHEGAVHKTVYEKMMNESTHIKLQSFFEPYNSRLYKMLGWEPVWGMNQTMKNETDLSVDSIASNTNFTLVFEEQHINATLNSEEHADFTNSSKDSLPHSLDGDPASETDSI